MQSQRQTKTKNTSMKAQKNSVVAIYKSPASVGIAIRKLQHAGRDLQNFSLLWHDQFVAEPLFASDHAGTSLSHWGEPAGLESEVWESLSGSACFRIPGIGAVLVAGPLFERITRVLDGEMMVDGLNCLGVSLHQMGLSKDSILQYEAALTAGKYILMAHGAPLEIIRARDVLDQTQPDTLADHQPVRPPDECYAAGKYFPARPIYAGMSQSGRNLLPSR